MSEEQDTTPQNIDSNELKAEETVKKEFVERQKNNPQMASFGERFLALLLDSLVVGLGYSVIGAIFGSVIGIGLSLIGNTSSAFLNMAYGLNAGISVFSVVVIYLYFGWFTVNKGQTPGKKFMKIKVVRADDLNYISWGKVFLRDIFGRWVSSFALFLGYLWYFMSGKRQCWHDSIAQTYVVKSNDKGDILMGGMDEYPKEPVKTFLPCGCIGLFWIVLSLLFASIIISLINAYENSVNQFDPLYDAGFYEDLQYDYDYDVESNFEYDTELEYRFNGEGEDGTRLEGNVSPEDFDVEVKQDEDGSFRLEVEMKDSSGSMVN